MTDHNPSNQHDDMPERAPLSVAIVVYLLGMAILIALGTWQASRLVEKETLLAKIDYNMRSTPVRLSNQAISSTDYEYLLTKFTMVEVAPYAPVCVFGQNLEGDIGYYVFQAVIVSETNSVAMLNLGWRPEADFLSSDVPLDSDRRTITVCPAAVDLLSLSRQDITATLRFSAKPHFGAADPSAGTRIWFTRDTVDMLQSQGLDQPAPYYLTLRSPVVSGYLPAQVRVDIPNNHLQYMLTWFSLAAVLTIIFMVWMVQRFFTRPKV